MPVLLNVNYKRYYNNNIMSCAGLFTLCILVLTIILPGFIVIYSKGNI